MQDRGLTKSTNSALQFCSTVPFGQQVPTLQHRRPCRDPFSLTQPRIVISSEVGRRSGVVLSCFTLSCARAGRTLQLSSDLRQPKGDNIFSASVAMDIMRTHPLTTIGGLRWENPFFVPPDQFVEKIRESRSTRLPLDIEQLKGS